MLCNRSFILLQELDGFKNNPETVDDLFRLGTRFIQRLPEKFFSETISDTLFGCAILGVELEHPDANRTISRFITDLIDIARRKKVCKWQCFLFKIFSKKSSLEINYFKNFI